MHEDIFCILCCSTEILKDGQLLTSTKAWPKGVATVWNDLLVPIDLYKEAYAIQCLSKLVFTFSFVLSCKSFQVYTPLTSLRRIRILNSFFFFLMHSYDIHLLQIIMCLGILCACTLLRLRIKWWWKQGPFPQEMNTQLETESKQRFLTCCGKCSGKGSTAHMGTQETDTLPRQWLRIRKASWRRWHLHWDLRNQ